MEDFGQYDAVGLAELIRRKEVTPLELVDEVIDRIERVNPTLNGVTIKMYDHARELAQGDIGNGPLAGVPFLLKDFLAEYAGVEYSASSRFLQGFVPDRDTELVKRFKAGGFITVAKTNLPEFAIGATTEPRLRGATHNPWDTTRTPGGSSGGAGAMVAAGVVPVAHGNDAGGSIRIPAAACGTVGLKPTRGRNPLGPYFGEVFSGFVAEHVLTRTVRDTAAVLDITAGPDVGDWYPAPPQSESYLDELGTPPGQASDRLFRRVTDRHGGPPRLRQRRPRHSRAVRGAWARRCGAVAGLRYSRAMARLDDDDVGGRRVGGTRLGGANRKEGGAGGHRTVHRSPRGARRRHRRARVSWAPRTTATGRSRDRQVLYRARCLAHADARRASPAAGRSHIRQRRPVRAAPSTGHLLAVHVYRECDRTAGDFVAARLERRQPAHRQSTSWDATATRRRSCGCLHSLKRLVRGRTGGRRCGRRGEKRCAIVLP